jgi:hypothetical protein
MIFVQGKESSNKIEQRKPSERDRKAITSHLKRTYEARQITEEEKIELTQLRKVNLFEIYQVQSKAEILTGDGFQRKTVYILSTQNRSAFNLQFNQFIQQFMRRSIQ